MNKTSGKSSKFKLVGKCRVCGCTDQAGCSLGCEWVNLNHSICSRCSPVMHQIGINSKTNHCIHVPLWALWVTTGGPTGRGAWMTELSGGGPAVFDEAETAFAAMDEENSSRGIGSNGFEVQVFKLTANLSPAKRPAKKKTPRKSRGAG